MWIIHNIPSIPRLCSVWRVEDKHILIYIVITLMFRGDDLPCVRCTYVYIYPYTRIYVYIYISTYMCYIYVYIYMYGYIYIHISMYTYTYPCTRCIYMYIYTYIYITLWFYQYISTNMPSHLFSEIGVWLGLILMGWLNHVSTPPG